MVHVPRANSKPLKLHFTATTTTKTSLFTSSLRSLHTKLTFVHFLSKSCSWPAHKSDRVQAPSLSVLRNYFPSTACSISLAQVQSVHGKAKSRRDFRRDYIRYLATSKAESRVDWELSDKRERELGLKLEWIGKRTSLECSINDLADRVQCPFVYCQLLLSCTISAATLNNNL